VGADRNILAFVIPAGHLDTAKVIELPFVLNDDALTLKLPYRDVCLPVRFTYQASEICTGVELQESRLALTSQSS
jgi:hypothetical protein